MKFSIIVSINNNNIIGEENDLIIESKKDLRNFQKITTDKYPEGELNICIMGYNTWISIPENKRPLSDRINIIITKNHLIDNKDNLISFNTLKESFDWCENNITGKIFVIGGSKIFQECCRDEFIDKLDLIYLTQFNDNYSPSSTTHSFPSSLLVNTKSIYESDSIHEICKINYLDKNKTPLDEYFGGKKCNSLSFKFKILQNNNNINSEEYQYLDIMKNIITNGELIESRNSKTYSLFGGKMEFDLSKGFPLLTTKHMGYKTILRELLWFLSGSTSNKLLNDKKVHIWDKNSSKSFLEGRGLNYDEGDLGPVYGFQWRHFGAKYKSCDDNYENQGIDQIKYVIDLIKNDPTSRRIIINAWNPMDIDKMALPPCHILCQFNVNTVKNELNCQLYQRSADMFLGVPFNIASYSFLTYIIAKLTNYKPGKFIHILGDSHIYESHLDAVKEQLSRIPYNFPKLEISDELINIDNIDEDYFKIINYNHCNKINCEMIA